MGEHPGNMFTRAGQMLRGIGLSRAVTVGATVGLTSSSASYCSTAAPTTQVRIAQYNILSDSLDAPDHYIHCDPNDLDHEIRFQRVAAKLEEQMRAGAVLCLQEVSRNWAGRLIPLFEKHGYTYASALTGSKFGGYMGQCLAWPAKRFEAADISTIRVADTVEGWPKWPKPASLGWWGRLRNHKPEKLPFCPWKTAESKHNGVVLVRLVEKESKKSFVVGTYHMPCMFGSDDKCSVMTIHLAMLFQYAQKYAAGTPLVVGGDFNIQPVSAQYEFVAQGELPASHPQNPSASCPIEMNLTIQPMRSAYAVLNGAEPEFTNLASTARDPSSGSFIETLDYIFLSPEWKVDAVKPLATKASMTQVKSFPSKDEPSDHVMIFADLSL